MRQRSLLAGTAMLVSALGPPLRAATQEPVTDTAWRAPVEAPRFRAGTGPRVLLDRAHHNEASLVGFYGPFGRLLRADGYRVSTVDEPLGDATLAGVDVLVVANALPAPTVEASDTLGSAFTDAELAALLAWVRSGGGLLLFVDHRPFPRAAAELARRLGLEMIDGYALDYEVWDPLVFRRSDGTLSGHAITGEVDSVATFYGHAMRATDPAWEPLMVFGPGVESMDPDGLWEIGDDTRRMDVEGWLQGAARRLGRGRVVVLGETGMAVAQRVGPAGRALGMNAPVAGDNARFLLDAVRWLSAVRAGGRSPPHPQQDRPDEKNLSESGSADV